MPPTFPDVDEIAVERAANGDLTIHLNRHELAAAWQKLEHRGESSRGIARILGVSDRTVVRWRKRENQPVSRPPGGRGGRPTLRSRKCPDCGRSMDASDLTKHRRAVHALLNDQAAS